MRNHKRNEEKEEILLALKPGLYTLHFQNKLDSAARVLLKVN